jgi:hypothetical protein
LIDIYANEIRLSVHEGDDKELWIETLTTEYDLPSDIAEDVMERVLFQRVLVNSSSGLIKKESIFEKGSYMPD